MGVHTIKKGLDLPITGKPAPRVEDGRSISRVGVVAPDYPLMKPRMHVNVGDSVQCGQVIFEDRKSEGVVFTAPAEGTVTAINRGEKRALQSVVIELSANARNGEDDRVTFGAHTGRDIGELSGDDVKALIAESGLWSAFRTRPFGRVPSTNETAAAIFVTAIDTNPLAGSVEASLEALGADAFQVGLKALTKLTAGKVWLCKGAGSSVPTVEGVSVEEFKGNILRALSEHILPCWTQSIASERFGTSDIKMSGRWVGLF